MTFFLLTFLLIGNIQADAIAKDTTYVTKWLKTNTINMYKPIFNHEKNIKDEQWTAKEFLNNQYIIIDDLKITNKQIIKLSENKQFIWKAINKQTIKFSNADTSRYAVGYAGFYIFVDKWKELEIILTSKQIMKMWIDGNEAGKKESYEKEEEEAKSLDHKLKLENGKHLVLIKTLIEKGKAQGDITAYIVSDKQDYEVTLNPEDYMTVKKLLYSETVSLPKISHDGEYVAINLSKVDRITKKTERWIEIRYADNGEIVQSYRGSMKINSITWSSNSNDFIYKTHNDGNTTVWIANIETGKNRILMKNVKSMGSFIWEPKGKFLIYNAYANEEEKDKTGVKLLRHLQDRQSGNRSASYMYKVDVKSGISTQLSFGKLSTSIYDISPDSKKAIISRYHPFRTERPFSQSDFYLMDLNTLKLDSLFSLSWASSLQFSPDGEQILITGGVSMFDGIGKNLPKEIIPNDFDHQAFIYYIDSKKVIPVTKNFDPAIDSAYWAKTNNNIYFVVEERSWRQLYEYNVEKNRFSKLDIGMEAIKSFDLAKDNLKAVYCGSSANKPYEVYTIKLAKKSFLGIKQDSFTKIYKSGKKSYKYTKLSIVKRWTFNNKDGVEIEGRYYLPPNFDDKKNIHAKFIIMVELLRFPVILMDAIHTTIGLQMVMLFMSSNQAVLLGLDRNLPHAM